MRFDSSPALQRQRMRPLRCGSAIVELAVALPVVILLFVSVISINSLIFLKQSAKLACYEGCRVGIVSGATQENVEAQVREILDARRVKSYTVGIEPADLASMGPDDYVRVQVQLSPTANIPFTQWFTFGNMVSDVSMRCER